MIGMERLAQELLSIYLNWSKDSLHIVGVMMLGAYSMCVYIPAARHSFTAAKCLYKAALFCLPLGIQEKKTFLQSCHVFSKQSWKDF